MLAKKNRLTKKNDFDFVFKKGLSIFNTHLGVKAIKNNLPHSRFGVIVSNKISKKANERNKIKRRIKDFLKTINKNQKINIDCVIITLPLIKTIKYSELIKSISFCFEKINKKIK